MHHLTRSLVAARPAAPVGAGLRLALTLALCSCGDASPYYARCHERCDPYGVCESVSMDRHACTDQCEHATSGRSEACARCVLERTGALVARTSGLDGGTCLRYSVGSPADPSCRPLCGEAPR